MQDYEGRVHYIDIDIEAHPAIAESVEIVETPAVQFFINKNKVYEFRWVKMKKALRGAIETQLENLAIV